MKLRSQVILVLMGLFLMGGDIKAHSKVVVCQIVEHQALNEMREGIQESLKKSPIEWSLENAQGNPTLAAQVAQKISGEEYDLIIALATPMAQAVASMNSSTPLLFGAVTDPVSSKLVNSMEDPGKNISGVIDAVPLDLVFDMLVQLVPDVQTIGVIYNGGELNSVMQVEAMKAEAKGRELHIIEATVSKSSEVLGATKRLVGEVDVILLPTDNTVISALEAITQPAIQNQIPIIGIDVDTVRRGALAALGVDWRALGRQLGQMAHDVLEGESPMTMPVQRPQKLYLHLNLKTAEKIGLEMNKTLLKEADKVYRN